MHSARKVANFLIEEASRQGEGLTPLQVIKLVYIAHGFMLGKHKKPLVADRIEAWKYGPVIEDLYHQVKRYGRGAITSKISEDILSSPFSDEEESIMRGVLETHGHCNGIRLSALTHQKGTPWQKTRETLGQYSIIPDDVIQDYYKDFKLDKKQLGLI